MAADPPRFVLFLPPVPSPPSLSSLQAAFGETLTEVLKEVASHSSESSEASTLEIALAVPELVGAPHTPRSKLYASTQTSLAAVYKLICVVAARNGIDVEDSDGVDVRVILVAWSPESEEPGWQKPCGPVADLQTLAHSGRQWQYAFGVESEAGEAMVRAFVAAKGSGEQISRVRSGPVMRDLESQPAAKPGRVAVSEQGQHDGVRRHSHVAVGGTFDHLHIGHKLLLTMTVFAVDEPERQSDAQSERSATIGITGDQLLKNKKHAEVLESWSDRQEAVQGFLDAILNFSGQPARTTIRDDAGPNGKSIDIHYDRGLTAKCTEIQDPFGPTITEEQISALIISGETRAGGKAVNDKRREKGWSELEVFEVDVLDAEDEGAEVQDGFGSKLSSTAIREKLASKRSRI